MRRGARDISWNLHKTVDVEEEMSLYVLLGNFTDPRMMNLHDASATVKTVRAIAESCGVELRMVLYTMGQYDVIAIVQAPSDEAMAKFALSLAGLGTVRTQTLKAFTSPEFLKIVNELPDAVKST